MNRDELRRELRDLDRAHREALGPWRRALQRAFGDRAVDPTRRRLLAAGGLTAAGATVLAACGGGGNGQVAHTGKQPITSSTAVPPQPPPASEALTDKQTDQQLLQTATSLELAFVKFYDQVLSARYIGDMAANDTIKLFRDQHQDHATALKAATTATGVKPYDQPNKALATNTIDPQVKVLKDPARHATDADWLAFLQTLENVAASTYVAAVGQLGTMELRHTAISIGAVEARHRVIFANLIAPKDPTVWVPGPAQTITDAVGSDELIGGPPS